MPNQQMQLTRARCSALPLLIGLCAACSKAVNTPSDNRVPVLSSEARRVQSRHVGAAFQISVVLPRSYHSDSSRRYPVVYLLDGNELTGVAAGLVWELGFFEIPEVLLIGVDYPVEHLDGSAGVRFRDLTPSPDTLAVSEQAAFYQELHLPPPTASGGGPAFLRFITEELVPFIDGGYRTKPTERTLLGFSLGGLFTLYALLEKPAYFQNYVAISPSLWWHDGSLLARFSHFEMPPAITPRRLFVSIGLLESDSVVNMVRDVRHLEERLRTRTPNGLTWRIHYFPDETHSSSWPGAMSRGLRYSFGAWPIPSRGQ